MRFVFQNHKPETVTLVVEPWATSEPIAPGATVVFEVNDAPAPEVEFALDESGNPYVYVMSESVRMWANGEEHAWTTEKRPPMAAFRSLRPIFHSN